MTTIKHDTASSAQVELRVMLITVVIMITGCVDEKTTKARGEARHAAFKECMELAAKIERKADDDVSNIVSECGGQAYYATNYI